METDAEEQRAIVRMLGAVLGDVIREQDGEDVFQQIEAIRRASVGFHREPSESAATLLSAQLGKLSVVEAVRFVHSFTTFLQVTNLAEDHVQRRRGRAGDARQDTLAGALRSLAKPEAARDVLSRGLIVPVITAHPSEVRRKSVRDHQAAIAIDLDALDRAASATERSDAEMDLRRQVSILWRTRLLRNFRIAVDDEIENAVSYFERSFVPAIPALYAHWEDLLGIDTPDATKGLRSFLRLGSWVGGDRDGNPNVEGRTMRQALSRQAAVILRFYLDETHALGAELSLSSRFTGVTPELLDLADRAGDGSAQRTDEPYRRALSGIYARLAATLDALTGEQPGKAPIVKGERYGDPMQLKADLVVIHQSLLKHQGKSFRRGSLARLIRAVDVFGFHLATLDMRQNSAVHARVAAELLRAAGVVEDYAKLDEETRCELLIRELGHGRLLASPFATYSDETRKELETLKAAADVRRQYGPTSIRNYIISNTQSVSDLLEVYLLLKEVGLFQPGAEARTEIFAEPLFETIGDLRAAPETMARYLALPLVSPAAWRGGLPGSDDRLFGFEQGRQLSDLDLGAAEGLARAACGDDRSGTAAAAVPRARRRGGAWRRIELRGVAGPAGRHGRWPHPHHRTGRGGGQQVWRSGADTAEPRDADGGSGDRLAGAAEGGRRDATGRHDGPPLAGGDAGLSQAGL